MHMVDPPMLKAALVAGNTFWFVVPHGSVVQPYERYLGVYAIVGTAGFDAGEITCALVLNPPTNIRAYPDAL
jgi:hypothetical protein